ncbi:MAG: hypothetical protein LBT98_02265 [Puniceicoccales bacterium]|jgi:hypothetical protein|nr:hypothetical protein [Puniceicoccales bacterium]
MDWTLICQGIAHPLAYHAIGQLRRIRRNQGLDEVILRRGGPEGPLPFPALAPVQILRDGVFWFSGVALQPPAAAGAGTGFAECRIVGPWWHLDSIVYQQGWNLPADPDDPASGLVVGQRSHLILGQSLLGQPLTLREQLIHILDYAIAAGAPFAHALGAEELAQTFPFDECKDLSCAEALRRVLRWVPDARLWFDYAEETPTLHLTRRAAAVAKTFPCGELHSLAVSARHDLNLQGVVLKYERLHRSGDLSWQSVETERFPSGVAENQPRVLVLTVELAGVRSHYLSQRVRTETIAPDSAAWWQGHLPALAQLPTNSLQILEHSRGSTLPRELVEGAIAGWMDVSVEADLARATIAYDGTDGTEVHSQEVAVPLRATDALSRTYSRLESFLGQEVAPQGLAQLLYECLSQVPYEGTLSWEDGAPRDISLAWSVNLSGGRTEWEEMGGEVQECEEEVESGRVTLRFGPPAQLGLDRLIRLARANRGRGTPRESYGRVSGQGEDLPLPELGPLGQGQLGAASYGKLLLTGGADATISLDANSIERAGLVLQPREEDVVEDGVLKKRLSIASQPYAADAAGGGEG